MGDKGRFQALAISLAGCSRQAAVLLATVEKFYGHWCRSRHLLRNGSHCSYYDQMRVLTTLICTIRVAGIHRSVHTEHIFRRQWNKCFFRHVT